MRYSVAIALYVWADSDEEAKQMAADKIKEIDIDDNRATVISICEHPTGTMNFKPIEL